jgi:hypothetical protein
MICTFYDHFLKIGTLSARGVRSLLIRGPVNERAYTGCKDCKYPPPPLCFLEVLVYFRILKRTPLLFLESRFLHDRINYAR